MKIFIFIIFVVMWAALGGFFPKVQAVWGSFFAGVVFANISVYIAEKFQR